MLNIPNFFQVLGPKFSLFKNQGAYRANLVCWRKYRLYWMLVTVQCWCWLFCLESYFHLICWYSLLSSTLCLLFSKVSLSLFPAFLLQPLFPPSRLPSFYQKIRGWHIKRVLISLHLLRFPVTYQPSPSCLLFFPVHFTTITLLKCVI